MADTIDNYFLIVMEFHATAKAMRLRGVSAVKILAYDKTASEAFCNHICERMPWLDEKQSMRILMTSVADMLETPENQPEFLHKRDIWHVKNSIWMDISSTSKPERMGIIELNPRSPAESNAKTPKTPKTEFIDFLSNVLVEKFSDSFGQKPIWISENISGSFDSGDVHHNIRAHIESSRLLSSVGKILTRTHASP